MALTIAVLVWSFWAVGLSPSAVVTGIPAMIALTGHLWPPDVHPDFLAFLVRPIWETATLSLAGLALAIVLAVPLALLATGAFWAEDGGSPLERVAYQASRGLLNFLRAVPDLAWALVFVAAVGLGAVPALLALGLSYGGMLGKIYAEIFEAADPGCARALHGLGARRLAIVVYGLWPQTGSQLLSYTLYSWECCMRAAAVMGFVGGGGIGYQIDLSMQMFKYGQVATLLVALLALIALVDATSFFIRRLLENGNGPRLQVRWIRIGVAIGFCALLISGLWANRQGLAQVFSARSASGMEAFALGFFPPDHATERLRLLPALMAQTLAISIAGTALGVAIAGLLCIAAARTLTFDGPFSRDSVGWRAAYQVSRMILNVLRAIPEVMWALLFVLAVGLGPIAGTLAIGVHGGGVLGKLFAEALEEADRAPLEALVASGAGRAGTVLYGALPVALPVMASYTLLRWDMNLRVAAILGFVGGGGLGEKVWEAINLGFYDRLATLILAILALVWFCDRISAWSRAQLAVRIA